MDRETRERIQSATQAARAVLSADFAAQLAGDFDIQEDGTIGAGASRHLDASGRALRRKLVAAVEHRRLTARNPAEAVSAYVREAAFTTLNRFVAFKMLEVRKLVMECVTGGEQAKGYREFCGLAPGLEALPEKEKDTGYRLFIECLCDEVAREVRVLFDRTDPASLLWPRRPALTRLLELLNAADLASVWAEDETIGWVYQYFNSKDERALMRDTKRGGSQAPRDTHELAVRNQFFTPRYVVEFLVDNTLGRTWYAMRAGLPSVGRTRLTEKCAYLVRPPDEPIPARTPKDPRELRILDPACGSGHFLLYAFELLETIYEEAWEDGEARFEPTGNTLREDAPDRATLARKMPGWILSYNLHGIDIDPRAAQIAALALWLRAQKALKDVPRGERRIERTNIVVAEAIPGDAAMGAEVADTLPESVRPMFEKVLGELALAGDAGALLRVERAIAEVVKAAKDKLAAEPRQISLGFGQKQAPIVTEARLWAEAESRIGEALRSYAAGATDAAGLRRRMFRHDTAQGLAFIEVCQKKYDVVLMNPPFGAASLPAKAYLAKAYPRSKNDLLACFVERGVNLLHRGGMLGAITSRTAFFLSSYEDWRKGVVLGEAQPVVFADLGAGVLDGAMVETAAFVLEAR